MEAIFNMFAPPAPSVVATESSFIMTVVEGFAGASLWLGVTPILIGLIFMAGGRGALAEDFEKLPELKGKSASGEVGMWMVHLIFFGGVTCWAWAISTLGLALGYSPSLALLPGFLGWDGFFLYCLVLGKSPAGFEQFTGPPLPLHILFGIASASLKVNLLLKMMEGAVDPYYFILVVVGVAGPQVLGYKARSVPDPSKFKLPPAAAAAPEKPRTASPAPKARPTRTPAKKKA